MRTVSEQDRQRARFNWLTPREAGERLGGMNAGKVRALIAAGHLTAVNMNPGGRAEWRIAPEWVEAYLERHTANPHAAA